MTRNKQNTLRHKSTNKQNNTTQPAHNTITNKTRHTQPNNQQK